MKNHFQEKIFEELKSKAIINKGTASGVAYLEEAFSRRITPTKEALDDLSVFEENFPTQSGDGLEIINQLDKYGAPATTMQLGGRYFGFVNGSVLPVGLSARLMADYWDQNETLCI